MQQETSVTHGIKQSNSLVCDNRILTNAPSGASTMSVAKMKVQLQKAL